MAAPTATNTKKDEVSMKSINAKLATAISSKVSGGGGFKSTSVTKQPAPNASKEPKPIDKYEKDLNKSDLNTLNKKALDTQQSIRESIHDSYGGY